MLIRIIRLFLLIIINSPILLHASDTLELPAGAETVRCEPVYTDDTVLEKFLVCVYKTPDAGYMVLKKFLDGPPGSKIVFILPIPKPTKSSHYMSSVVCLFDGNWMQGLFAEVLVEFNGTQFRTKVIRAWQIDVENINIYEIDKSRIKCIGSESQPDRYSN